MNKAEEIHYKAVIAADNQESPKDYCISAYADHFNGFVEGFVEGYHQAEKDLHKSFYKVGLLDGFEDAVEGQYEKGYEQAEKDMELTWEDIADILDVTDVIANDDSMEGRLKTMSEEEYYQEVLKRFKEKKENG